MKMTGNSYHVYRSFSVAVLLGLLLIGFMGSCGRRPDPVLAEADSKMEEHPDSALMLLDGYDLTAAGSALDSAYYALLLTHARYKNFIDETNDSLISRAVSYFLDHGDDEKASRALFLQGIIQMNANRLGEAAVSFRKGLDIAHEGKYYMWEGQCARGLHMLYERLHNASAQVKYADIAHDAFLKSGDKGWQDCSEFEMAVALNNNCKYKEALSILARLDKNNRVKHDTTMLSQVAQLRGLSLFGLGRYEESIKNYIQAYNWNPDILTENDRNIIDICLKEVSDCQSHSYSDQLNGLIDIRKDSLNVFTVLAGQEKYKEAYRSLERYKNLQDSVLSVIFKNNVSESVSQYEAMKHELARQKLRNERMSYWLIILVIIIICIIGYWRFREQMHLEESKRLKIEAAMESLRLDLKSQLESSKRGVDIRGKADDIVIKDFVKIIKQRYADTNRLCDDYYQGRFCKSNKDGVYTEINSIVRSFIDPFSVDKIVEYVDEQSDGLYSAFKKDFFDLSNENHRLFLYLMLGFSSRTISVILGQSISVVYNKKSRLKSKIEKSQAFGKDEYLRFF